MFTIVLPAFNEGAGLGALLDRIGAAVIGQAEILVVDDGSTDETRSIAAQASRTLPVNVISHPVNLGYGRALRTGLLASIRRGGTVVTMDADESHDPALIGSMLRRIAEGYELVIASRFQSGGAEIGVPWERRLLSLCARLACWSTLGIDHVRDYTSGYRAYSSSLLQRMICAHGEEGLVRSETFVAGLELLINAASVGASITEIPLVLRYDQKRSASKLRITRELSPYLSIILHQHRFRATPGRAKGSLGNGVKAGRA